jgi:hypothetical protein
MAQSANSSNLSGAYPMSCHGNGARRVAACAVFDIPDSALSGVGMRGPVWTIVVQHEHDYARPASFTAVNELQEHIDAFIAAYNEKAEPFAWTKKTVRQRRFKVWRITQL